MPFWRTYYHLVWATKKRAEIIHPNIEPILYAQLRQKATELEIPVYAVNGWWDHVHMIVSIPPKPAISVVVKGLKGTSSYYVNQTDLISEPFFWQRGYGVFTLGESQLARAIAYVQNQKEHHQRRTLNTWLEQVDVFDEDLPTQGMQHLGKQTRIHEESAVYTIN